MQLSEWWFLTIMAGVLRDSNENNIGTHSQNMHGGIHSLMNCHTEGHISRFIFSNINKWFSQQKG